jgi:hypothetical protein
VTRSISIYFGGNSHGHVIGGGRVPRPPSYPPPNRPALVSPITSPSKGASSSQSTPTLDDSNDDDGMWLSLVEYTEPSLPAGVILAHICHTILCHHIDVCIPLHVYLFVCLSMRSRCVCHGMAQL